MVLRIPMEDSSMRKFGASLHHAFNCGQDYQALIWNIYKSKKPTWERDFNILHPDYDILLLQEAKINFTIESIDHFDPQYCWVFGESFAINRCGSSCGVLTGARIKECHAFNKHGPIREPFINTPKSTAFSYYKLTNRPDELLIINSHFINFRSTASFQKQLSQIIAVIESHLGPILYAGDFNTWNRSRTQMLVNELSEHGLRQIRFANESRSTLMLDHIFVRDLQVSQAALLTYIKSSDHIPLTLSFYIPELLKA